MMISSIVVLKPLMTTVDAIIEAILDAILDETLDDTNVGDSVEFQFPLLSECLVNSCKAAHHLRNLRYIK